MLKPTNFAKITNYWNKLLKKAALRKSLERLWSGLEENKWQNEIFFDCGYVFCGG